MKTTWSIGSFSNALRRVQRDISKNRAEEAVVYMPYNWSPSEDQDNDPSIIAIKRLLWSMVNRKWSFSWMLTPELHESVGLPAAFSLQYAIIAVGAVEAGYDSILTPYTYYGAKPEGAARGKAITVHAPANGIRAQKDRYWGGWGGDGFAGAIVACAIFIHVLNHSLDRPKHLLRRARLTDRSSSV